MEVLEFADVTVCRGDRRILDTVTWTVRGDERWVVIGPNGAGKSTLLQIAAGRLFPTSGTVRVLGETLGAVDVTELRQVIGWASASHGDDFPRGESVRNVVLTGAWAVTGRWRERYDRLDEERADGLLRRWGLADLAQRTFATLSEGERKRTLIARALMSNPELLLLDEPGAALDLGGREDLVTRLADLARDRRAPAQVLVTHHVEEIPAGFTHALLLGRGRVHLAGPIETTVTSRSLSDLFESPITVHRVGERLTAQRTN